MESEQLCLTNLPLHIISKILSFLPLSEILQLSLTCQQWFEATLHADITKNIAVKFVKREFTKSDEKVVELMNGSRYFSKMVLRFVDVIEDYDEFWIRYGKYIEEIEFEICEINQNKFFHLLQFLPNLKKLRIEYTSDSITDIALFDNKTEVEKDKIKNCLSSIDTLELHNLENLTDEIFEKLASFTKNIKSFILYDCRKIVHSSSVVKFCKKHEETLVSLHISSYDIDQEQYISGLANLQNLKLKYLNIKINKCSDVTLDMFFIKQKSLEHLIIEGLNNTTMKSVCHNLNNLKQLTTDNCYAVKDSLANVNELTRIEALNLSGVGNRSDEVLLEMLKNEKPKLRELKLCHPLTNDSMTKISESCPNLEVLDLRFMHPIPQRGAQMLFKNLTNLTSLLLRKHAFSVDDVDDVSEFICSITNLQKLTSLEIDGIGGIVGLDIEEIAKLKNLTKISIDSHYELDAKNIKHLALNSLKIEEISFCYSRYLTDELIDFITKQWKNLKTLHLVSCDTLTDKSLYCIAGNCKNLKVLNLMRSSFSEEAVECVRKLPKINVIYF